MATKKSIEIDRKTAAKLLKVSIRTVDRYITGNRLSTIRKDGRIWLDKKEVTDFRSRHKVDTVDSEMSIDKSSRQVDTGVYSVSTRKGSKIAPVKQERTTNVFKKLFEELRDEFREQQKRLEGANYRVGQLEGMLRESIPLRDHQKLLSEETVKRLEMEENIETTRDKLQNLKSKLKEEKLNRKIILTALYILLALQPLWIIFLR